MEPGLFAPLVTSVTDTIAAVQPTGITIMGALIGVSMIPRVIYKFF